MRKTLNIYFDLFLFFTFIIVSIILSLPKLII
jgi:hypothetical protein